MQVGNFPSAPPPLNLLYFVQPPPHHPGEPRFLVLTLSSCFCLSFACNNPLPLLSLKLGLFGCQLPACLLLMVGTDVQKQFRVGTKFRFAHFQSGGCRSVVCLLLIVGTDVQKQFPIGAKFRFAHFRSGGCRPAVCLLLMVGSCRADITLNGLLNSIQLSVTLFWSSVSTEMRRGFLGLR